MNQSIALRSTVAGVVIGSSLAGGMWWAPGLLDDSAVLIATVGIVWTVATASLLYVTQAYPSPKDPGPWGTVIGGSLLFGVVLTLSDVSISNSAWAALTVLTIGFTLLGYAAGMGAVSRRESGSQTTDETVVDG